MRIRKSAKADELVAALNAARVPAFSVVVSELGVFVMGDAAVALVWKVLAPGVRMVSVDTTIEALQQATLWQIADGTRKVPPSESKPRSKCLRVVR